MRFRDHFWPSRTRSSSSRRRLPPERTGKGRGKERKQRQEKSRKDIKERGRVKRSEPKRKSHDQWARRAEAKREQERPRVRKLFVKAARAF